MIFNVTGGGGAALNFKVLAYATKEELLAAAPAENAIGAITTTPITSYIFSAEEPSPAVAGQLWITTGTSSPVEFNALKKNAIQVYPLTAKQYIGGAWVAVTAMIYQGKGWINLWGGMLYNYGEEFEFVTGGWEIVSNTGMTITKNTDHVLFDATGSSKRDGGIYTKNKIDLTDVTILNCLCDVTARPITDSYVRIGVILDIPESGVESSFASYAESKTVKDSQNLILDVSSLSGEYHVGFYAWASEAKVYSTGLGS